MNPSEILTCVACVACLGGGVMYLVMGVILAAALIAKKYEIQNK
jgi:hypothetical protein